MKTIVLPIIVGLFLTISNAQNDSIANINTQVYNSDIEDYFDSMSFNIGGGILIPQGNLKSYFGASSFVELAVNFPLRNKKSIELVVQLVIPNQTEDFQYIRTIDTLKTKATFMFNPMLKFKKALLSSRKSQLNIGLGLGASIVTTNARNPFYDGEDVTEKYESITAFLLEPTLEYSVRFNAKETFAFGVSLHYSPYKIEGAVREDIGGLFYVPKITYQF
jgi:hypothetical protein